MMAVTARRVTPSPRITLAVAALLTLTIACFPTAAAADNTARAAIKSSASAATLESGVPLGPAPFLSLDERSDADAADEPINPLSTGTVTVPLGYANVFGGERPDVFIVNNRLSTEPGLYLYQYLGTDPSTGSPFFRKRVQCTHPFKGVALL